MITVHAISPQNEMRVAEHLATLIRRAWPDVASSKTEHVDLLVGIYAQRDVDLLIAIDLEQPRSFPKPLIGRVKSALIVVEIKQLDGTRFERVGDELFARYEGGVETRSVADQARSAAHGVRALARESGFPRLFVHALAWLTEVSRDQLRGANPSLIGAGAGWFDLLGAAANQHDVLYEVADPEIGRGVRGVRGRILNRRQVTAQDRVRWDRLSQDVAARKFVDELAPLAGRSIIRITGRGGTGKTTTMALLANRLATVYGARVLLLTFHHALCGDIKHLLERMPEAAPLLEKRLRIETYTGFLLTLLDLVKGGVPQTSEGLIDYGAIDSAYAAAAADLAGGPDGELVGSLKACDRDRFEWDHVLIDEAQDCTDAERDLLRAAYGHRSIAIADGLEQLVRRQTPCDWIAGLPRAEVSTCMLGESLRMLRNIADFANAFARAAGFTDWHVAPRDDMPGGRIVVLSGGERSPGEIAAMMKEAAAAGKADPVDCLVCVPYTNVIRDEGFRRSRFADALKAAGSSVWDASDQTVRTTAPESRETWRVIQYDSCRGLEGWATLALDLDDLYAHKLKHPNLHAEDRAQSPEDVARRWLMIPLTRAVHTLIVTVRDPESPVMTMLREAANAMPPGVVEFSYA